MSVNALAALRAAAKERDSGALSSLADALAYFRDATDSGSMDAAWFAAETLRELLGPGS